MFCSVYLLFFFLVFTAWYLFTYIGLFPPTFMPDISNLHNVILDTINIDLGIDSSDMITSCGTGEHMIIPYLQIPVCIATAINKSCFFIEEK